MSSDLRTAARGVGWNYLGSAVTLGCQVLYTALTARLISPSGFGAYAAAQALVALVGYFGLATIGNAVIRHPRHGRSVIGTAFGISLAAGTVVSLVVFACAGPWAQLWGVPESGDLARLFSVVLLLSAAGYVPLALLRKALRYRRAALIEAVAQVAGMCIGAAVAVELRSPLALVVGQAVGAGLTSVAALAATRAEIRLAFSTSEARALLSFSGQVSAQNLVYFALYSAPSLLVSRLFGAVALGGYSRANVMVTLPVTHLWVGVTKTLYPLIARGRDDAHRLRELIESALRTTVGLSWPLFAAVAGASPLVVRVFLGARWSGVASLLPPILAFGALNLAYVVAGNPLEVLAYQRLIWRVQLLWLALLGVALSLSYGTHVSLVTMLWAVAAVQAVAHTAKLWVASRVGLLRLRCVAVAYGASMSLSAAFLATTYTVDRALSHSGSLAGRAAAEILVVAILVLLTGFLPGTAMGAVVRAGASRAGIGRKPLVDRAEAPAVEGTRG